MRKQIERVFAAFEFNLVPIVVTILTCYVLFAPAQFREIHRAFAQRLASLQTLPISSSNPELWSAITTSLCMLGGLIALSLLLWLACRENLREAGGPEGEVAAGARKFVSLGLAVLPFLALSAGLYAASFGLFAASSSESPIGKIKELLTSIKKDQLLDAGTDPSLAATIASDWADKIASYNDILIGAAVLFALLGLLLVFDGLMTRRDPQFCLCDKLGKRLLTAIQLRRQNRKAEEPTVIQQRSNRYVEQIPEKFGKERPFERIR